jgi:2'-5' RNA ligase
LTLETALLVTTAEAEESLATWRRRYLAETVRRQIPAHVTVLYPFVPAEELTSELDDALRQLYAPLAGFEYALATVETFPGYAWLAPDPAAPFLTLIEQTRACFPDHPPYGDPDLDPIPHCTVGAAENPEALEALLVDLRAGLAPRLPIACRAMAVRLYRERDDGTWCEHAAYPLGRG